MIDTKSQVYNLFVQTGQDVCMGRKIVEQSKGSLSLSWARSIFHYLCSILQCPCFAINSSDVSLISTPIGILHLLCVYKISVLAWPSIHLMYPLPLIHPMYPLWLRIKKFQRNMEGWMSPY